MPIEPAGVLIAGDLLRHLRKLTGNNLVRFAPKLGISVGYLSQIERGTRTKVSPELFARICDELQIEDRRALLKQVAA